MSHKTASQEFQDTKVLFFVFLVVVVSRNKSNAYRPGTSVNWSCSLFSRDQPLKFNTLNSRSSMDSWNFGISFQIWQFLGIHWVVPFPVTVANEGL